MYLLIVGVIVAVFLCFLGFRMIIRALPNTLSEDLFREVESACQMNTIITVIGDQKTKLVFWRRLEIGMLLLSHTNILSKLIGREHRLEVASLGRRMLDKIPESSPEIMKPSGVLLTATRENIRSIVHCAESNEGDHLCLLRQINEIRSRTVEALDCAKSLDNLHDQIEQFIEQFTKSGKGEVMETANVLAETLHGLEKELGQCGDLNPVALTEKICSMNELLQLCIEVMNESRASSNAQSEDWVDYYEVLGIQSEDNIARIKSAYRFLASKFHPDRKEEELSHVTDLDIKGEIERTFNEKMVQTNLAYQVLSDPNQRNIYDTEYSRRKGQIS